ncbi:MAG TPA: mechanosensitive ion channel family protein [Rhizomicrobium sp.]|jgi:small-conductance mechanosensitive channel|nr:mechanosensitive ion channel family protein [Rhizomicrobium sp.]
MQPNALSQFVNAHLGFVPSWIIALGVFAAIFALGVVLQGILYAVADRLAKRWHPLIQLVFQRTRRVGRFAILIFAVAAALPLVPLPNEAQDTGHRILVAAFVILIGWIALVFANIAVDRYIGRLKLDVADNLMARKAVTQMRVLRQAIGTLVVILTVAFALMSFDTVRQFGISLFASAGVAGLAAGLAARPLLGNLIAGIQLAITQPIRIDDAVVIDGEWGWIEEFTSTYVVVRLWDWRRQIVPLEWFSSNVFTNWTRSSSAIIGTVMLYLDYTAPVERLRKKAEEIAKASKLWNGQVINVQVSDATENTIQLRVLVSAATSPQAWDLRCEMREKLLAYIQSELPHALPRRRGELEFEQPHRQSLAAE